MVDFWAYLPMVLVLVSVCWILIATAEPSAETVRLRREHAAQFELRLQDMRAVHETDRAIARIRALRKAGVTEEDIAAANEFVAAASSSSAKPE